MSTELTPPDTGRAWSILEQIVNRIARGKRPIERALATEGAAALALLHFPAPPASVLPEMSAALGEYFRALDAVRAARADSNLPLAEWATKLELAKDNLEAAEHSARAATSPASGACILTAENIHTADDCTLHDHESPASGGTGGQPFTVTIAGPERHDGEKPYPVQRREDTLSPDVVILGEPSPENPYDFQGAELPARAGCRRNNNKMNYTPEFINGVSGVYAIIHRETGCVYVGSTVNLAVRRQAHVNTARRGGTPEQTAKRIAPLVGRKRPEWVCEKIKAANAKHIGKRKSPEVRERMKAGWVQWRIRNNKPPLKTK